jgi:O-antigen ligase
LLTYAKTIENKLILTLVSALELTAIILTYSRSTYLFLFISFFVLSILRSRKLLLIGITAIIILFILFPRSFERIQGGFSIDESAKHRFKSWANTVTIIRDYPILGVGYNTYRYAQENYGFIEPETTSHAAAGSDASFLTIFATTGVLGVISFILFYLISIIKTKKIYNFSESLQKRAFGLALFPILIGLAFHSIFVNSLLYPAIMIILFVLLGLISADTPN